MCYFIERTQKCTKLFFNHYLFSFDVANLAFCFQTAKLFFNFFASVIEKTHKHTIVIAHIKSVISYTYHQ